MDQVERALYSSLVRDESHKKVIQQCNNGYEAKRHLERFFDKELRTIMLNVMKKAYSSVSCSDPILYIPLENHTQYSYYWGSDAHGYGWNLVGKALVSKQTELSHQIYDIYRILHYVIPLVQEGHHLEEFVGKPYQHILLKTRYDPHEMEQVMSEYKKKTLPYYDLYKMELKYPNSLLHMLRKEMAPHVNSYLQESIYQVLWNHVKELYRKEHGTTEFMTEPTQRIKENMYALYKTQKMPLTQSVVECIKGIESRYWSDDQIHTYLSFKPCLMKKCVKIIHERNDPLSPFSPFSYQEKEWTFDHRMEYGYWKLYCLFLKKQEAYNVIKQMKWEQADVQLESLILSFLDKKLTTLLEEYYSHSLHKQSLLKTGSDPIYYSSHYDPLLGHYPLIPTSNRMGQVQMELRTKYISIYGLGCLYNSSRFSMYCMMKDSFKEWCELFPKGKSQIDKKFFKIFYPRHYEYYLARKELLVDKKPMVEQIWETFQDEHTTQEHIQHEIRPLMEYIEKKQYSHKIDKIIQRLCEGKE